MEPTKADGCNDTHRHKSIDTETNAGDADKSLADADGVRPSDLTQFEVDILAILAGDGTPEATDYGLAIKRALEDYYGCEVGHGRLYPNLDGLIERGLVEKRSVDKRTNGYALTEAGRDVVFARIEWLSTQVAAAHRLANAEPAVQGGEE